MGWLVFSETISSYTTGGAILIVAGCLIAAGRKPLPPEIEVAV
jgi:S-adenosylmethionine uptake transporter